MFVKFLHILQNPTADRCPLFWETFLPTVDLTGLTFDLGNECPGGCECLHGVQEWVSGDDLTHDPQNLTQALMGQWPAGFKEICWAELAWVRRKRLAPAFPASQRSDGETEAGLDGVSPSKFINFTLSWTYTRREEVSSPTVLQMWTVRGSHFLVDTPLSLGGLCQALCLHISEQQGAMDSISAKRMAVRPRC